MKLECPVCKSNLHHKRVDDAETINEISPEGQVTEITSDSNGSDSIYCSKDRRHKIPRVIYDKA
ncbi:hypothetical protein LMH73_020215, partial [Vibrio splendidus]